MFPKKWYSKWLSFENVGDISQLQTHPCVAFFAIGDKHDHEPITDLTITDHLEIDDPQTHLRPSKIGYGTVSTWGDGTGTPKTRKKRFSFQTTIFGFPAIDRGTMMLMALKSEWHKQEGHATATFQTPLTMPVASCCSPGLPSQSHN